MLCPFGQRKNGSLVTHFLDLCGTGTSSATSEFKTVAVHTSQKEEPASRNEANLENGTYEQIVSHPEKELELNSLDAPDETQTKTVTQHYTKPNLENLNRYVTIAID